MNFNVILKAVNIVVAASTLVSAILTPADEDKKPKSKKKTNKK